MKIVYITKFSVEIFHFYFSFYLQDCSLFSVYFTGQKTKINELDEPYFGTHILSDSLPSQTFEIPKKNTQPLISTRGLAFYGLLQSSEK